MKTTQRLPLLRLLALPACMVALAASAQAQSAPAPSPTASGSSPNNGKDVIELSPFTVSSERDTGYFAENTLAGSRLNTNIADLAASITVVTKQQLEDTGSIDINDVFMYEANTQGANTFTPINVNRSNLTDNIGGWNGDDGSPFSSATANRVRGLGRADTAQNNYPTIARLAFDAYNTNSIEINRGPNSMLFGTGSPAGIVNQSTSEAVLRRLRTTVSARYGSFDSWRASIATNVPLGDKVAIYAAALYDSRGFQRKPSSDVYRRQYGAITLQPWQKTKITASYEHYDNYNNRPNFLPPQDFVTPWLQAGRPGWNPATQRFTFADGRVSTLYLNSTRDARFVTGVTASADGDLTSVSAAGVPGPFFIGGVAFATRNTIRLDHGVPVNYWVGAATAGTTTATLPADNSPTARTQAQREMAARRLTQSAGFLTPRPPASSGATGYGTWLPVHVTDQSIYNWEKHNVLGANYGTQEADVYNVEFQQQIFHNLYFSAGWFRQEFDEWTHYGLGQANQVPRLYVDTNSHFLDGSPNAYFGAPFVLDWQADSFFRPESNDNLRAMLSFEHDFGAKSNWLKWLGRHRFLGLVSRQDQWSNNLRYRLSSDSGDARFLPTAAALAATGNGRQSWAGNSANIQRAYYVGHSNVGVVDQGVDVFGTPDFGGPTEATMRFFDWTTNSFSQTTMGMHANLFYAGGNYGVATRETKSKSFSWQGWLLQDRIMPTFGWRTDEVALRQYNGRNADGTALTNEQLYSGGFGVPGYWDNLGPEFVFKGDTVTRGGVVRPFKGWSAIESKANDGSALAQFLQGLSFHYNESDNFNAPPTVQVDFLNRRLPPPSGEGRDFGVGFSMFDEKLYARLNWYEASNKNAPSATANTVVARLSRMDTVSARRWAEYVVRIRSGQPMTTDFHNATVNPLSAQQEAAITQLWWGDFPLADFQWPRYDGTITATESNSSKGVEVQLTYNPLRNWTMKLTGGKQTASYTDAGAQVTEWINFRKPQWEAMRAPDIPGTLVGPSGNVLRLESFWSGTGFTEGAANNDANSNRTDAINTPSSTYTSIVDAVYFPMLALEGTEASDLPKYTANYITNYQFTEGRLKGLGVGGSVRWQDKVGAGYYGLLDPATYARPTATTANVVFPDLDRQIFVSSETNVDLWVSYTRKLSEKITMKLQLNVRDAFENGGLKVVQYNMDGSPAQYRIKDPRTWFLTTTFDF